MALVLYLDRSCSSSLDGLGRQPSVELVVYGRAPLGIIEIEPAASFLSPLRLMQGLLPLLASHLGRWPLRLSSKLQLLESTID